MLLKYFSSIIFSVLTGQEAKGAWKGINFDPPYDQSYNSNSKRDNIKKEIVIDAATKNDINEHKSILSSRFHSSSSLKLVSELKLHYCRISYAETGIVAETSEADIQNCMISNNLTYGVRWQGIERRASGKLSNSVISDNDAFGVYCYSECFDEYAHTSPEINGSGDRLIISVAWDRRQVVEWISV